MLPGDRLVIVADGRTVGGDDDAQPAAGAAQDLLPWYEGLLQSVAAADGEP